MMKKFIFLLLFSLMGISTFVCSAREVYPLTCTNNNNDNIGGNRPRLPQWQNYVVAILDDDVIEIVFTQSEGRALVTLEFGRGDEYIDLADSGSVIVIPLPEDVERPISIVVQTSMNNTYEGTIN